MAGNREDSLSSPSTGPASTGPQPPSAGVLNSTSAPATAGGDIVTLLAGTTFCLSAASGDITPQGALGLFAGDARVISRWELRVDGESLLPMLALSEDPGSGRFILRRAPAHGEADSTLLVVRDRTVGDELRETLTLENLGAASAAPNVTLAIDADFADVFAVKEGRATVGGVNASASGTELVLRPLPGGRAADASVRVSATEDPLITPGAVSWRPAIPAAGRWSAQIVARPIAVGAGTCGGTQCRPPGVRARGRSRSGQSWDFPERGSEGGSEGGRDRRDRSRESGWAGTAITSDTPAFDHVLERTAADLRALRIHDPAHPDRPSAAAGAPWFMTLFGRDSLLTAWMALPLDVGLAVGTLQTLAGLQGRRADPATEEEPGRIMHERRRGPGSIGALGGSRYYGTVDATPLFVMLLTESWRWGASETVVRDLLPAADAALDWITRYGDKDGDGFVEYRRAAGHGLANQGWKDSPGSINHADGRPAQPPIALCEVQGYVYAAWQARAELAGAFGDQETAARCRARAAALRASFDERFWLPGHGWYAVALDGLGQPVSALTSNAAHCLWTGIATDSRAAALIEKLAGEDMDTGFGLRTLAAGMGAYNPMSYHNGSVWPHDTAVAVAGLLRYAHLPGAADLAGRLANGMLAAIDAFGGRPPELYCGFDRGEFGTPVPYPASCSPQAWASAAPLLVLRAFLGLDPDVPRRCLSLRPQLPARLGAITISGLKLGTARVCVTAHGDVGAVEDLPPGWTAG